MEIPFHLSCFHCEEGGRPCWKDGHSRNLFAVVSHEGDLMDRGHYLAYVLAAKQDTPDTNETGGMF